MIVDAHQHFWDPATADYPWLTSEVEQLRRRFDPDDLAPLLDEHGVGATVVVQARASLDETRALLELAAATPFVAGVVGWIDLTGDFEDPPPRLRESSARPVSSPSREASTGFASIRSRQA